VDNGKEVPMHDVPSPQCFQYLSEILHTLTATNQHERILHFVVDRIVRLTKCQTCAVILIDPKTEYLTIQNWHGLSLTFCNQFRRRIATAAIGNLLWTGDPIVLSDSAAEPGTAKEIQLEHPFRSCVCVQISLDHRTLGYLHVDAAEPGALTHDHVQMLGLFADIVALAVNKSRLFEENLRLERVDKETGVEKYLPLLERLQGTVIRAKEFGEKFGVLLLDVDNFKEIVKTYGYDASRELLRSMAGVLRNDLRPIDAVGRYGFDEFLLLLENTDPSAVMTRAQSIRESVARQPYTEREIRSTVSIGAASFPEHGITAEDLILAAKKALFEAQRSGGNDVRCLGGDERVPGPESP
jgi:two-component system cell cycle response regulator